MMAFMILMACGCAAFFVMMRREAMQFGWKRDALICDAFGISWVLIFVAGAFVQCDYERIMAERREILRERAAIVTGYHEHVDGKPDREYEWIDEYTVKPRKESQ